MKNLLKDESAILNPILSCMLSLAVIVIMYFMLMPLLIGISNYLIQIGAPASQTLLYVKMARYGFILFAAGAFLILLARVYKQTHDTGYADLYK